MPCIYLIFILISHKIRILRYIERNKLLKLILPVSSNSNIANRKFEVIYGTHLWLTLYISNTDILMSLISTVYIEKIPD